MQEKDKNLDYISNYDTAADIFIRRLQTGILSVNVVKNDADDYPTQKLRIVLMHY